MRGAGYIVIIGLAILAYVHAEEELYSDKYDDIDVKEILENERLRNQYYKCFMDIAPCVTPDAQFFKGNFGESVVTKCKKCTAKQKQMFEYLADWYTKNKEDEWKALIAKFLDEAKKANA